MILRKTITLDDSYRSALFQKPTSLIRTGDYTVSFVGKMERAKSVTTKGSISRNIQSVYSYRGFFAYKDKKGTNQGFILV